MKKLILFLTLILVLGLSVKAFAWNPAALKDTVSSLSTPKPGTAAARKAPAGTNFSNVYQNVYLLGSAIDQAGPKIAANLTDASGRLFFLLAVISLILWSIQNLMFGDKGVKEFMLYFFFLMVVRGLLAAYNFFFVGGVAVFFKDLGQMAAGTHSGPMAYFGILFLHVYADIIKASLNPGTMVVGGLLNLVGLGEVAAALIFFLVTIILLILALIVLGTIVLIHAYIAIALITGYILVPFMIFKPLEFLWNGWLKFLITACLSYFLLYVVLALAMGSLDAVASSSALNASPATLGSVLAILFLLAIFSYLIMKVPSIAGEIVSGMPNMSFSGVVGVAMTIASVAMMGGGGALKTVTKTADAIRSAAKGGKKE
jgi:hypothetical protein